MKKFLVISNDLERNGAAPGPHTLRREHEAQLASAAGDRAQVLVVSSEEAVAHFSDAEAVAAFPMRMPDAADVPQAKWLHSFSAGVDRVLTPAVAASDILVSNSSGVHATPIAEHILGFILMFSRGFPDTFRNQEMHQWKKAQSLSEIKDSTVLIVGMGEIGTEAARLAGAFGAHVWAVSRSGKNKPDFVERLGTSAELDAMLPDADYVVITLPHTDETHHLFNKEKFGLMKKSAVLINIGRGGIINETKLVEALNAGTIAGAGLDVTETEPLPAESPLWDMQNVIITPHHSGLSERYMDRAVDLLCKNIGAYLAGEPLPTQVDKKLGY